MVPAPLVNGDAGAREDDDTDAGDALERQWPVTSLAPRATAHARCVQGRRPGTALGEEADPASLVFL